MNVLLVYPRFPITYWGFQYGMHLIDKRAALPPLGLLTVAALLPIEWDLRLVDLNVGALTDDDLRWAELVLTGGLLIQAESMQEVVARAVACERPVAVGGPAPTASPDLFADADVVFQGEAEGRIDDVLRALARPSEGRVVLQAPATFPDMTSAPVPRFDLLDLSKYASVSVQYSRGCPFQCEFCDVIEIFGRKPRVKSPDQVLAELEAVYRAGYRGTLFFVDDNFIGNRAAVRRLLPIVKAWQDERARPFEFYTEASVDLADDPKLLVDMVDAGFSSVFVGIETPSRAALEQTNKLHNLRVDLSDGIDRITRAGIEVMGGFIVGFDTDDEAIFAQQREFIASQPMPLAMVGLLTALPGTALGRRLEAEGRLRERSNGDQFSRPNFVPAMDERTLLRGYIELMEWLYSPKAYYRRCEAYLDRAGVLVETRSSTSNEVGTLLRTIWHVGLLGPRRSHFWRLMVKAMSKGRSHLRQAVAHAVQGEHLITYTRTHLVPRLERALGQLQAEFELRAPALLRAQQAEPASVESVALAAEHP
ncbi:MAG: B12-binding domain-containing radical SAM protein [Deltaproteobacteria bacterium]|nr:B12-binding domain-containing radical SAM protein [Deltaproteobacteria bacterium]MBW2537188.1 B12-binding domain-containing radical SAM protein [Deltaproteobacteria bacterium]